MGKKFAVMPAGHFLPGPVGGAGLGSCHDDSTRSDELTNGFATIMFDHPCRERHGRLGATGFNLFGQIFLGRSSIPGRSRFQRRCRSRKISRPTHGNTAPRGEAPGKPRWFFGLYLNMEITIALNPGDPLRGMWGEIVGGFRPGWRAWPHALCCRCARIIVSRLPLMIPAMPMAVSSGYQAPPGKERGNCKARVHNGPKKTAPPRRIGPEQRRIE